MSKKHGPSSNDQRSVVKNPNHPSFRADRENRIQQGHPIPPLPDTKDQPSPKEHDGGRKE